MLHPIKNNAAWYTSWAEGPYVKELCVIMFVNIYHDNIYLKRISVMLEFSSCKRGNNIKNRLIELEELIADTENVKNDISTERKY